MKADHATRHDQQVRWECLRLTCTKRFLLIQLHPNSNIYQMVLLSSLTVHPLQAEQRLRVKALIQDLSQSRAEHILNSNNMTAFVPDYDPLELESWTSHLDTVTRCGIHQTCGQIQSAILQMQQGRKRQHLEGALEWMRLDILRSRLSVPSRSIPSTQYRGVVMRQPRARLQFRQSRDNLQVSSEADSEPRNVSTKQPSPTYARLSSWLLAIGKAGIEWQGRALATGHSTCVVTLCVTWH
eukprot:53912-Rhodomonas_salina.2